MKRTVPKILTTNVLFCGTGGQGVLSAAEVLSWAAISDGCHVKKSEVHGMAQRGGSVESHVRFGPRVFSPLIPAGNADYLVSFLKEEGQRMKPMLRKGGVDLTAELEQARSLCDDRRYFNSYLLGVLSRRLSIRIESWFSAIDHVFGKKNPQANRDAFLRGRGEMK
ncbi:MAG TPA: indolepyruvate oxidoreductase subunit beta [Candidatus Omnitrophota bacterium]|nr:indolepyruvate oxidoreductase subunit beta [Candidatus Omnitrophota bacterium]